MAKKKVNVVVKARDQASRKFNKINKAAAMMGRTFKRMAFVGGAAAVGLGYVVNRTMQSIDATAKLSDRLNIATEDLIKLQYATQIMGGTSETLTKSLERLAKGLGDIDMGSTEAQYALDKLGISLDDMMKVGSAEQLKMIADAMGKLDTATDKMAVAQKLFGRGGKALVNLLMLERKGIEKLGAEAEKLGLVYSRIDAAKVEAANDALLRVKSVLQGITQTLTIQLAPHIEAAAKGFTDWATEGEGLKAKMIDLFEKSSLGVLELGDTLSTVNIKWKNFAVGAKEAAAATYDLIDPLTFIDEAFLDVPFEERSRKLKDDAIALRREIIDLEYDAALAKAKIETAFNALRNGGTGGSGTGAGVSGTFNKINEALTKVNDKLSRQIELYGQSARAKEIALLQKAGENLKGTELDAFNLMLTDIREKMEDMDKLDAFAKMAADAERLKEALQSPVEKFKELRDYYAQLHGQGLISSEQLQKAIGAAGKNLLNMKKEPTIKNSMAWENQRFLTLRAPNNRVDSTERNTGKTAKAAEQQNQLTKKVIDKLDRIAGPKGNGQNGTGQLTVSNFN